jgi:hypothetical protein
MMSQEQDVHTDYDRDHREHVTRGRCSSSHRFVLLCAALSGKPLGTGAHDPEGIDAACWEMPDFEAREFLLTELFTRRQPLRSRSFRRVGARRDRGCLATVSAVTDSTWLDTRREDSGERPRGARRRQSYLPSAQVVQELASLGPDLGKLADELRQRLSDPAE